MDLTVNQRIRLVLAVIEALNELPVDRMNVILSSYDLLTMPTDTYGTFDPSDALRQSVQDASDEVLIGIAEYFDLPIPGDVMGTAITAVGLWKPDVVRVFLSHLATHKEFASQVSERLEPYGIQGFVAHTHIEITAVWQTEIERALNSTEVLVGLLHAGFCESSWSQQEVGWALGRGIPVKMIRLGEDPKGFSARHQWRPCGPEDSKAVAMEVVRLLNTEPRLNMRVSDMLIAALRSAGNYFAARDAAEEVRKLGTLTPAQLDAVERAYIANDQIHSSVIARPVVAAILHAHGRQMPQP